MREICRAKSPKARVIALMSVVLISCRFEPSDLRILPQRLTPLISMTRPLRSVQPGTPSALEIRAALKADFPELKEKHVKDVLATALMRRHSARAV